MPDPLESSPTLDGLVPVNTQRFVRPRIVLVCIVTLTRHEDFLSITLQVHERQGMRLRPRVVDDVLEPHSASVRVLLLLVPEDSIIVPHTGDQIGQAITVHIFRVNEPCCAKIEFLMKNPLAMPRVRGRLEPPLGRNDVVSSIFVDITHADTMAVAVLADDVTHPFGASAFARDLVPGQGKILVAELRQQLVGLA